MKFVNCPLDKCDSVFQNRKIIFFGCGSWLRIINHTPIMKYEKDFLFVVDNGNKKETHLGNCVLDVCNPDVLLGMKNIAIVLTSPVYMYDMYLQIRKYNLDDSCVCVSFPFMQMISGKETEKKKLEDIKGSSERKIPKIIHSFWFSGDEKNDLYKKCIDSWQSKLADYEIIEWNQDNYDCCTHPFVKKAIEEKAWAFASDYARLDVLNRIGGIYLDMDVEVFKSFDDLLCNDAILSYSNNVQVDLAVIGSKPGNNLIRDLLGLYDDVTLPKTREDFSKFFQPAFVREELFKHGIKMDGSLQRIEDAAVFPKEFFMPQEHILFAPYERTANTYCVHYDNFGWSFGKDNKREKKIKDNRRLWEMIK